MNRKSLYLAIGSIDDDLIQEASEARGHRTHKIRFIRLAGMAACLCLICTTMLFGMNRDVVYYNEAPAPLTAKVLVPSDENTKVLTLTYEELFDHYGLEPLPDVLSGLQRSEQSCYFIYQSPENTVYDTNIINYRTADGTQTVSVMLTKDTTDDTAQKETAKESRIDGVSLILAAAENKGQPVYWAELHDQGVSICVVSTGMDEASFTDLIRELIQHQK